MIRILNYNLDVNFFFVNLLSVNLFDNYLYLLSDDAEILHVSYLRPTELNYISNSNAQQAGGAAAPPASNYKIWDYDVTFKSLTSQLAAYKSMTS